MISGRSSTVPLSRRTASLPSLAAKPRRVLAHRAGAAAEPLGHAVERSRHRVGNAVGGNGGARRGTAADALEAPLECPQAAIDFADVG